MAVQKYMPEGWKKVTKGKGQLSKEEVFEKLAMARTNGLTLEGLVKSSDNQYNLLVDMGAGVIGIVPREEVSVSVGEDKMPSPMSSISKVGKTIQFKVKDLQEDKVILSRKEVETEVRKWLYQNVKPGMVLAGIVRNLEQYGAFIEIGGGVVGLIHIEDISVARIKHPRERFRIGDKVKVLVKSCDKNTGRIVLSYKELLGTWEENIKNFKEGTVVTGIVRSREKNGIFIELKPNLVGLAEHKSGIEYGQKVDVRIKKIIPEKKKIKLVIVG